MFILDKRSQLSIFGTRDMYYHYCSGVWCCKWRYQNERGARDDRDIICHTTPDEGKDSLLGEIKKKFFISTLSRQTQIIQQ